MSCTTGATCIWGGGRGSPMTLAGAQAVESEAQKRAAADAEIDDKIKSFATGGLHISIMGLVWLAFGVTFGTIPAEVLACARWTVDTCREK